MKRGFTLIELLVVITILAILAGAALPYVQSYVEESRIAKAKTDLEEVARALAVYETREGTYLATDVRDITGRYLNKAPIDPWGKPYYVATTSGVVRSGGPDRAVKEEDPNKADDDISVPYQPPLALVQVKWVDKNQSGAVDTQNVPDQIQMYFSRPLASGVAEMQSDGFNGVCTLSVDIAMDSLFDKASTNLLTNKRVIVLNLVANPSVVFTPGSDTITIKEKSDFLDVAGNVIIASQAVLILPQ